MIIAVVVTYDRPTLLRDCLSALYRQRRRPDVIMVVDDASPGAATASVVAACPGARHLRHTVNHGGAGAYRTGIECALAAGADLVWLMDDDAHPAADDCLERLVALAEAGAGIAAPLVVDRLDEGRLAFPIREHGRSRFLVHEVATKREIKDFAHLFNGALVTAETFRAVGLPDPRFVCRGDEVDFLLRTRRAGIPIRLNTGARIMHPSSGPEIHPILFGLFYATVPVSEAKQRLQFRNRGYIFRAHRLWLYLAADILRYGCHFLLRRRPDLAGMRRWFSATGAGWRGAFMRVPVAVRHCHLMNETEARFTDPVPAELAGVFAVTRVPRDRRMHPAGDARRVTSATTKGEDADGMAGNVAEAAR